MTLQLANLQLKSNKKIKQPSPNVHVYHHEMPRLRVIPKRKCFKNEEVADNKKIHERCDDVHTGQNYHWS